MCIVRVCACVCQVFVSGYVVVLCLFCYALLSMCYVCQCSCFYCCLVYVLSLFMLNVFLTGCLGSVYCVYVFVHGRVSVFLVRVFGVMYSRLFLQQRNYC